MTWRRDFKRGLSDLNQIQILFLGNAGYKFWKKYGTAKKMRFVNLGVSSLERKLQSYNSEIFSF